ncbi:MAG TPA: PKD domain-containing protein [Luteibaculaceae bacterium]|nr:PKD domain-containing protein [Luteibaculaceae bacterium]
MKRFYLVCISLLLWFGVSYAQLGGGPQAQTCASALNIANIPYNSPLLTKPTTCGNGNTYGSAQTCANTYSNGEDFVYKFTPTAANRCINISLTSYQNNFGGLFVFDGCPDQATTNCVAQQINRDASAVPAKTISIQNLQLTPGTTYFIMVSSQTGCYQFDFSITAGTCTAPPSGNDCVNSINIASLPFTDSPSTTCNNRPYLNQGNTKCFGGAFLNGNTKIYKYTAPENQCVRITLNTDSLYTGMFLYRGCPTQPSSSCVASRTYAFGPLVINTIFTAGQTYYLAINSNPTYSACIPYDLKIDLLDNKGSICPLAYEFSSSNETLYDHTTQCKGDEYDLHPGCNITGANYMAAEEVVYKFDGKKGDCMGISLKIKDDYVYAGLYLLNACPDDPAAKCVGFVGRYFGFGNPHILSLEANLDSTQTYWVVVGKPYGGDYYDFSYDISIRSSNVDSLGRNCVNADNVSIPLNSKNIEVSCKGNEYNATHACRSNYMAGNDYVLKFTANRTQCLRFTGKNPSGPGGLFLTSDCPDVATAECLASAVVDYTPADSVGFVYTVEAGKTYYVIVAAISGSTTFGVDLSIDTINDPNSCSYCGTDVCIACTNIGFERMDFTGWQGFTGTVANPGQTAGLNSGPVNNGDTRHTVMSKGSFDPMVGSELSVVSPRGGNYAVRLGNRLSGGEGEMLVYEFTVDANTKNFFYYYAVVFEDPNHTEQEQPYFRVRMFDQTGGELGCAHFEVRAAPSIPGFKETPNDVDGIWKDWTLVAVPLENYIGQRVRIEFTTLDCSLGGHYGYAYVDAFCGDIAILADKPGLCQGETVTLTAPDGFASYQWSNGATTQSTTVGTAGVYTVELTPFTDNGLLLTCKVSLDYEVKVFGYPTGTISQDLGCPDSLVTLTANTTPAANNPITSLSWNFGDGQTGAASPVTHGFPGPGTYNVSLTMLTEKGCNTTINQDVTIAPYPQLPPLNTIDTIHICERQSATLYADNLPNVTWSWTGPSGFTSNIREPLLNNLRAQDSGYYRVTAQSTTDPCLSRSDSTLIQIDPFPQFAIKRDTTICFNDTLVPVWATGGSSYQWSPATSFTDANAAATNAIVKEPSTLEVLVSNTLCPDSIMRISVNINKPQEGLTVSDDVGVCVDDPFSLSANASPRQFLKWTGPNGFGSSDTVINILAATPPMEGYYKVKAFLGPNNYCPFGEDSIAVDVFLPPGLVITPSNPSICPGDSVVLVANGAVLYTWSYEDYQIFAQGSQITYRPDSTSNVISTGIDDKGCENARQAQIVVKPQFTPDLGPDRNLCKGESFTIELNEETFHKTPNSVIWSTGQTGYSITVTQSGTYRVDVEIDGCLRSDSIYVDFQDPAAFTLGPDPLLCQGQTHILDVRAYGSQITWEDGTSAPVRNIPYPGGTYHVEIINGSCILKDTIQVAFQDQHAINLGPDQNECLGTVVPLSTPYPGEQHKWTINGQVYTTDTLSISQSGPHQIKVEVTIGVCIASDEKLVIIENPPVPNLGPDTTVCENQTVQLSPKILAANSYLWSTGSTAPTITVSQAGTYDVRVIKGACTVFDTITVIHDLLPVFDLGPDPTICEDKTAVFDASGATGSSFAWNTGANTSSIEVSMPGTYIATATRGACQFSDQVNLLVDRIPVFTLGSDALICLGDSSTYTCPIPNATYLWNTGSTGPQEVYKTSSPVILQVTRGMCSFADTAQVTVQNPPSLSIGPDQRICSDSIAIFASNVSSGVFNWHNGMNTPSITTQTAGWQVLTLTDGPCIVKDSALLTVDLPPTVNLGVDYVVCDQLDAILDSKVPNATYLWSTGETQQAIRVTQAGTYNVFVQLGECKRRDTIRIDIQPMHTVSLPADQVLCRGEQLELNAITSATNPQFTWNTGQQSPSIVVTSTNSYSVQVTTGVCTNADTILVTFVSPPQVDLGPNLYRCLGETIVLDAYNLGASYQWSTGENSPQITVNRDGVYAVTANIGPCITRDEIDIRFHQPPVLDLGPDLNLCEGEVGQLSIPVDGGSSYSWSTGQTGTKINVQAPGSYVAEVSHGPCILRDTALVMVWPLPAPTLGDTMLCPGDSLILSASCTDCSYIWNDLLTEPTRWAYSGNTYQVAIETSHGCKLEQQVVVYTDPDCIDELFVPNSFTPNSDGVNDAFYPVVGNTTITDFKVFDRWGELIFNTQVPERKWDGTYKGKTCKTDTYIWRIEYINQYGKTKVLNGHVNLLR